jgi:hypothetical protein
MVKIIIFHLYYLYSTLIQRRWQFCSSYATMEASSIIRVIVNDTALIECSITWYGSWDEVLIGGWHLWGNIGD